MRSIFFSNNLQTASCVSKKHKSLMFESLENRELLSVAALSSIELLENDLVSSSSYCNNIKSTDSTTQEQVILKVQDGTLRIDGTSGNDWIQIRETDGSIDVISCLQDGAWDTLLGTFNKSTISTIEFYGGNGDDIFKNCYAGAYCSIDCYLYGGDGNDYLMGGTGFNYFDGGNGNNLLLGGTGINEFSNTGLGSSCFIWRGTNDSWADVSSNDSAGKDDAHLLFYGHNHAGATTGSYNAVFRSWTESELFAAVSAIQDTYSILGNYHYFRNDLFDAANLSYRQGSVNLCITNTQMQDSNGTTYGAYNNGNTIVFGTNTGLPWNLSIVHEFAHYWDHSISNPFYHQFQGISWESYSQEKVGGTIGDFAREYGRTTAGEDWATTIELVLGGKGKSLSDRPTEKFYDKLDVVFQFLNWIGDHDTWGQTEILVTTVQDTLDLRDGAMSLREAILFGGRNVRISFAEELHGKTIVLNGEALTLTRPVSIDASGHDITIDGNNGSTIIQTDGLIQETETNTIIGLSLTGGASHYAVDVRNSGTFIDVSIFGNHSSKVLYGGSITMHNSVIADNNCNVVLDLWGISNFTNTLIYENVGHVADVWGVAHFFNSTITKNGGGVHACSLLSLVPGTVYFNNSIVALNETNDIIAQDIGRVYVKSSLIGLIDDLTNIEIDDDSIFSSEAPIDPKFVNISGDWSTWDLHLQADSPALGAGNAALIPAGITRDFEGNYRRHWDKVDMGAYQHSYVPGTPPNPGEFGSETSLSNLSSSGVTVSWTAPQGYEVDKNEYSVYIKPNDSSITSWTEITTTTGLSVDLLNLSSGTSYVFRIDATINGVENLTLASGIFTTLDWIAPPAGLTATPQQDGSVQLQWQDRSVNETGFELQYSADSGLTWTTIVLSAANGTAASWESVGVCDYLFRVRGKNDATISEWSDTIALPSIQQKPNTPSNPDVQIVAGIKTLAISWGTVAGATRYRLERSLNGTSGWSSIYLGNETFYTDSSTASNTTYYYRVFAENDSFASDAGQVVSIKTGIEPLLPPANLTANLVGQSAISLSWQNVSGATEYHLERSTSGNDNWVRIYQGTGTLYEDATVQPGTTYYYRVTAVNSDTSSTPSPSVTQVTPRRVLSVPTGFSGEVDENGTCRLQWTDHSQTGFELQQSTDGGTTWTLLKSLAAGTTSTNTMLSSGVNYSFRIRAVSNDGESEWSQAVSARYDAPVVLSPPTGVAASWLQSQSARIVWNTVPDATAYRVERSLFDNGGWTEIYTGSNLFFDDLDTIPETRYYYRVFAVCDSSESDSSLSCTLVTPAPIPSAPTGLSVADVGQTNVDLTWANTEYADMYYVERYNHSTKLWSRIGTTVDTRYVDSTVKASTSYIYRIIAANTTGVSSASDTVTATTLIPPPSTPISLKATTQSSTSIKLSWQSVTGAETYRVEYSLTGNAGSWQVMTLDSATSTGGTASELEAGTKYHFRVCAVNSSGESAFSFLASATTMLDTPGAIHAVAENHNTVRLQWTAIPTAISYTIERSMNGTTWTKVTTVKGTTEYTHKSLSAATTYYYRISATSAVGTTAPGEAVAVSTKLTAPGSPTVKTAGSTSIDVSWKAVKGATGYVIQRSVNGTEWLEAGVVTGSPAKPSFTDTGLEANTQYHYRVLAAGADDAILSAPSPFKSSTTAPEQPPNAVITSTTDKTVLLTWNSVEGATSYKVERLNNGRWVKAGTFKTNTGTVKSLKAGTEYTFRIVSISKAGSSTPSEEITAQTRMTTPGTPTVKTIDSHSVSIAWKMIKGATGYLVQRSLDGTNWGNVVLLNENPKKPSFIDTDLDANTTYVYRVIALGESESQQSVASKTRAAKTAPASPANVQVTMVSDKTTTINWDAVAGATSYKIERWNNGKWVSAGTSKTNTLTVKSLKASTDYTFRVIAVGKAGKSSPSVEIDITTLIAPPTTPKKVMVQAISESVIQIRWEASGGAESYRVERYDANTRTWSILGETSLTFYEDQGLAAKTSYGFRVTALNSTGASKAGSKITVRTL